MSSSFWSAKAWRMASTDEPASDSTAAIFLAMMASDSVSRWRVFSSHEVM